MKNFNKKCPLTNCIPYDIIYGMKTLRLSAGTCLENKQDALQRRIREKIERNEYSDRLPTLRDLAAEHHVNYKTIRKALESLKQEGIISFYQRKGIIINENLSRCIGMVGGVREEANLFKEDYLAAVLGKIIPVIEQKRDYFSYQQKTPDTPFGLLFKNNTGVDALLILSPSEQDVEELKSFKTDIPVMIVGTTCNGGGQLNYIDSEHIEDSRLAVDYLAGKGHKRIAFICVPSPVQKLRLDGYRKALAEHGIPYDRSLVIVDYPYNRGIADKTVRMFSGKNSPTAIFGASCWALSEALETVGEEKRNSLDIIVYDDFDKFNLKRFGIRYAVVRQPLADIGRTAIQKLYELMDEPGKAPVQIRLKSQITHKT